MNKIDFTTAFLHILNLSDKFLSLKQCRYFMKLVKHYPCSQGCQVPKNSGKLFQGQIRLIWPF